MNLVIIPVAEANVTTLMQSIDKVIINPIIIFLFACAMVYFLYGVAQYLLSPENEEIRKKSKSHMIWGIVGLFIMVAVFGIMNLILNTLGETKIKINSNGDYVVEKIKVDSSGNIISASDSGPLKDRNIPDSPNTGKDIFTPYPVNSDNPIILAPITPQLPSGSYTTNPFTKVYVPNSLCWRAVVNSSDSNEYKALQKVRVDARNQYLAASGVAATEHLDYPYIYDRKTMYDSAGNLYYVWWDVRAPLGGGTINDCNLAEVLPPEVLPAPSDQSTKPNPLVHTYTSDANYYRVVDSGVDFNLGTARAKAINNAFIQIAKSKGLTSTNSLYSGGGTILEEQYYTQDPPNTGNYDYWIAIQYKK